MIPTRSKHTKYNEITDAEWIVYDWQAVRVLGDGEEFWMCIGRRGKDEAMRLAGGSMEDLQPYLEEIEKDAQMYDL